MNVEEFTGCCTAKILTGFGQTQTADWDFKPDGVLSVEVIKARLGKVLNEIMVYDGVATVITNDQQANANQALEECGFLSSDWMSKKQHPETRIKLWWFPINEKQING
jgi:hypothetical protein